MSNMTMALVFVLTLNVLMMLTQFAVLDLNPTGEIYVFNTSGSVIDHYVDEGVLDTQDSSITGEYPEAAIIEPTSGNPFTDTLSSIRGWFSDTLGLKYIKAIVSGPYNILKAMNLPNAFVITLGTFWYALTFFIIIAFFWSKE